MARDPLDHVSARIKEIYIELHGYAFFHGPSEVDRIDRRFTGREEVLERLKSLLTDHESPTGSYLVTGFRGAGKSSLVAKALADLERSPLMVIGSRRILRIASPVIALALLDLNSPALLVLAFCGAILLLSLCFSDPRFEDLAPKPPWSPLGLLWRALSLTGSVFRAFILEPESPNCDRPRAFKQDFLAVISIVVATGYVSQYWRLEEGFWRLAIFFGGVIVVTVILPMIVPWLQRLLQFEGSGVGGEKLLLSMRRAADRTYLTIKRHLRFLRRVHIKINLSQDNLQEIDILRAIARNLESDYRRFSRPNFHRYFIRFSLLLPFLILSYQIYNGLLVRWVSDVKRDFHVGCYLPSQAHYLFAEGKMQGASGDPNFDSGSIYIKVLKAPERELGGGTVEFRKALDAKLAELRSLANSDGSFSQIDFEKTRALERVGTGGGVNSLEVEGGQGALALGEFVQEPAEAEHEFLHESSEGDPLADGSFLGLLIKVRDILLSATTGVDTLIQLLHYEFRSFILEGLGVGKGNVHWPPVLDYMLLLTLALGWFLPQYLFRWSFLDRPSSSDILRRLSDLNEMIDAEVTHERGGVPFPATTMISLSFGRRSQRTYRVLNAREIEKRLIDILSWSTRVSPLEIRPEFVVVFDELDKIQFRHSPPPSEGPPGETTGGEKWVDDSPAGSRAFGSIDIERERQQRILSMISNLKHFLSTAPAKFIFIAGREMFDAALADVSDRHFFMGSIFNEVIHVPSFHSDDTDNRLPDITSLPEEYLSRFLLPESRHGERPSLTQYNTYLREVLLPNADKRELNKIIYELHNFVTYLTYRSNGAPKKITSTLERFVTRLPKEARDPRNPDSRYFVVGRNSRNLYLRFRYPDQYAFGLVTYLASPLIFSVNRAIKDYGDKVLVSSAFVLDHLFKFHGHGFSWRNLELLPEVVDINRAPQLRELIGHIMRFLSRSHINEIISGLYHFKFTRRISEEINFLSKLSEFESAAFNFTLDESLALKQYFYRRLERLLDKYGTYPNEGSGEGRFVNSVSFLRMILGDLHFYDGEYDSAIVEYLEAIQQLRRLGIEELKPDILLLMTRNYLKLGLTYEKKKSFDAALMTFGRIADMITEAVESTGIDPSAIEGFRLVYQPIFARLQLVEKATLGGIEQSDLDRARKDFEAVYRATRVGGWKSKQHRFLVEAEYYNKVGDILFFKNGPMPKRGEVYCKPGLSVSKSKPLCFENPRWQQLSEKRRRLPCQACRYYNRALDRLGVSFLQIPRAQLGNRTTLMRILEAFEDGPRGGLHHADRPYFLRELADVLSDLGDTYSSCFDGSHLRSTGLDRGSAPIGIDASFMEGIGVLLAEATTGRARKMEELLAAMDDDFVKLREAILYFSVAAILLRFAAHHRAASIQMIKILWLFREYFSVLRPKSDPQMSKPIAELTRLCIRELHRTHEGTHRLEIEKLKELLEESLEKRCLIQKEVDLGRLSINANITEILVLQREIQLSLKIHDDDKAPLLLNDICSPYTMFHSVYSRIHALRLRSRIHFENFRHFKFDSVLSKFVKTGSETKSQKEDWAQEVEESLVHLEKDSARVIPSFEGRSTSKVEHTRLLEMMLVDAAYCNHEIVRLLRIYGRSYMASHTMKAAAHTSLAFWCNYIFAYIRFCKVEQDRGESDIFQVDLEYLQKRLEEALGPADMVHLSPNYQREMALRHWRAAIQAHGEGQAYRELLEDMFYLNDDFADILEHFCAALERFRINSGFVDEKIEKLVEKLNASSIYEPKLYLNALVSSDGSTPGQVTVPESQGNEEEQGDTEVAKVAAPADPGEAL